MKRTVNNNNDNEMHLAFIHHTHFDVVKGIQWLACVQAEACGELKWVG